MGAETIREDFGLLEARHSYDAAFRELTAQVRILQSLADKPDAVPAELEVAGCRLERAHRAYRESRDRLVELMLHGKRPAGERASNRADVERFAYELWENAGRPAGSAEEHWCCAERVKAGGL